MAYEPIKAGEDNKQSFELYNVVYPAYNESGEVDKVSLGAFFDERNKLKWTPFYRLDKEDGSFEFKTVPYIYDEQKDPWIDSWINDKSHEDKNIYAFIQDKTFTLIIYNSQDHDSILTKDIIVKQYTDSYNREVANWKDNGVIIYDVIKGESEYDTFEGTKYFDLNSLKESPIDEVFLCGYIVEANLVRQFAQSGERLFIFESNPLKINDVRSILRAQADVKFCTSKTSTKAYQAYTLFRDPIGNIKPEDNDGLRVLKLYSDAATNSFDSFDKWKDLEKSKILFEEKILDDSKNTDDLTWRQTLVNALFGTKNDTVDFVYEDINLDFNDKNPSSAFITALETKGLNWTGNAVAINTEEIPTFAEVNHYVHDERAYDQIITFYKADDKFWTVNVYKTERDVLNAISIVNAQSKNAQGIQNIWYTPTGIPVVKVEDFYEGKICSVKWYNVSGTRNIPVNNYVLDSNGKYVFDIAQQKYVEFDKPEYTASNVPGKVPHYVGTADPIEDAYKIGSRYQFYSLSEDKTNLLFDEVYPDTADIDFNNISLIDKFRNKYYCQGNKYVVTCSLTDKQMYECLKTKSIMG